MHRLRKRTVIGVSAAFALLAAGLAYASIPDSNNRISACYARDGSLRVIDTGAGDSCRRRETALAWDALGARVTEFSRLAGPSSVPAGPTDTTIVAASLPAGFYDIRAHTIISTSPNIESTCTLTFRAPAAASEIEVDESDEANLGGGQSVAKHELDGVWQFGTTPVTVRLKCHAPSTWFARGSSIIATRVTSASIVSVTSGDPVGP